MSGTFEGFKSLQFTPDNKFAYAYSGAIAHSAAEGEKTYLEFQTNSEYLDALVQAFYGDLSGDWWKLYIYFNNELMTQWATNHNAASFAEDLESIRLIIPPFTTVKCSLAVGTGTVDFMNVNVTGKVYGAIEQENLEAITDNNNWASK